MPKADLGTLVQAVDRAAAEASRSLALLLTVCLVFLATVIETTHQDIFLNTSKPLPQIGARLPLIGIFVVVPVAIAILHMVAVLQVRGLVLRTRELCAVLTGVDDPRLPPALLVQWIVARRRDGMVTAWLLSLLVLLLLVVIPLGTLLAAQVRFLPYHAAEVTWLHRGLILTNVLALCTILILAWTRPHGRLAAAPVAALTHRPRLHPGLAWSGAAGSVATCIVLVAYGLVTVPDEWWEERVVLAAADRFGDARAAADACADWPRDPRQLLSVTTVALPGGGPSSEPAERRMLCAVHLLAENANTSFSFFRRNLVLREARLVGAGPSADLVARLGEREAWQTAAASIAVSGRDLRYADLTGVHLRGVDLRAADLRGARLNWARLEFTDLGDAAIGEVGSCPRELQEQVGRFTYCQTRLAHADLSDAMLRGARLWKAQLDGATLRGAQLFAADLRFAHLHGLDLDGIDLAGVDLDGAQLAGASLRGADLRGARLVDSDLRSVDLSGADLRGANLAGAWLDAADLSGADMRGADVVAARFDRSVMAGARLDSADLRRAQIVASVDAMGTVSSLRGLEADGADLRALRLTLLPPNGTPSAASGAFGEPSVIGVMGLVEWVKAGPLAHVELGNAQIDGLVVISQATTRGGAFAVEGMLPADGGQSSDERRAMVLAELCADRRRGAIGGLADRIGEAVERPAETLRVHEFLLALRLQRRDCHAAAHLSAGQLCRLQALERAFEGRGHPLPGQLHPSFQLSPENRRTADHDCARFG